MDKRKFLKSFLLQEVKINRLISMSQDFPENAKYYNSKIKECHKLRQKIEGKINGMENELLKEILTQKYICGKTLEEIALILNYSTRHIERLHRLAIEKIKI